MTQAKKLSALAAARQTIVKLKEVNREQLNRIRDYYMLKKLNHNLTIEVKTLRLENKQLDNIVEQLRGRLRKYEASV